MLKIFNLQNSTMIIIFSRQTEGQMENTDILRFIFIYIFRNRLFKALKTLSDHDVPGQKNEIPLFSRFSMTCTNPVIRISLIAGFV